jgi:Kef-type K+ transport system membrane component KefB
MTTNNLFVIACVYLLVLVCLAYLTRATVRRIAGAVIGGAVAGLLGLAAVTLGDEMEWWRVAIRTQYLFLLAYIGLAVSLAPFYLVSWRIARRYGLRGLAVGVAVISIVGPVRDYAVAATFPDWIVFSPGFAPIVAVSMTYVCWTVVGHAAMRLVAGPAKEDLLRGGW